MSTATHFDKLNRLIRTQMRKRKTPGLALSIVFLIIRQSFGGTGSRSGCGLR